MYARNYGDDGKMQSFKRGEYSIPANYAGNAFTADEIPDLKNTASKSCENEACIPDISQIASQAVTEPQAEIPAFTAPVEANEAFHPEQPCAQSCTHPHECCECRESRISNREAEKPRQGIFRDLLSRFERGFELDDLLLIGLIILLLNNGKDECEGSQDEIIILLAFLLISGF